jgi:hypothetical protein
VIEQPLHAPAADVQGRERFRHGFDRRLEFQSVQFVSGRSRVVLFAPVGHHVTFHGNQHAANEWPVASTQKSEVETKSR